MTDTTAAILLVFSAFILLALSIILNIHGYLLHQRCVDILACAYDWLETLRREHDKEVYHHEGTD